MDVKKNNTLADQLRDFLFRGGAATAFGQGLTFGLSDEAAAGPAASNVFWKAATNPEWLRQLNQKYAAGDNQRALEQRMGLREAMHAAGDAAVEHARKQVHNWEHEMPNAYLAAEIAGGTVPWAFGMFPSTLAVAKAAKPIEAFADTAQLNAMRVAPRAAPAIGRYAGALGKSVVGGTAIGTAYGMGQGEGSIPSRAASVAESIPGSIAFNAVAGPFFKAAEHGVEHKFAHKMPEKLAHALARYLEHLAKHKTKKTLKTAVLGGGHGQSE